jgi:hypothetical protein
MSMAGDAKDEATEEPHGSTFIVDAGACGYNLIGERPAAMVISSIPASLNAAEGSLEKVCVGIHALPAVKTTNIEGVVG